MKQFIKFCALITCLVLIAVAGAACNQERNNEKVQENAGGSASVSIYGSNPGFSVRTMEDFEKLGQSDGHEASIEQDTYSIQSSCLGLPAQFIYHFNEENKVTFCEAIIVLSRFEDNEGTNVPIAFSGEEMKIRSMEILYDFCEIFSEEPIGRYSISGNDGQSLDITADASYEQMAQGNAYLDFTLRDADGTVWIVKVYVAEEGIALATIARNDSEEYADFLADINISQKGE